MKPSLCRLLLVAALSLLTGTLPAKTLTILLLANASRQDVIQKARVQVPRDENEIWTWDQFKQAVATVMRLPECRMGVAYDCSVQRWSNLLYQANGKWISADGKSFLPEKNATEQALAFFRTLVEARLVPTSAWPGKTDAGQLFKTGVAAMMWSGNWQLKSLVDGGTAFEFGTTYFPKGVIRATCPGGEFFFGFENSPNKDAAAKFLLWWAQPEITQHYLESLGGSLLSPMSNLKVNYGKYTEYLAPMLSDLNANPGVGFGRSGPTGSQPVAE